MATRTSKSTLELLLRIAWRTVGAIVARVVAEGVAARDPLEGLRRIGIDEISYKKGHRYITIVVDHDTGRLVWAAPGRDRKTLTKFFAALGERAAPQSLTARRTRRSGSPTKSPRTAPTPSAAPIRSISSPGPATPWTRSDATPGTPPARPG